MPVPQTPTAEHIKDVNVRYHDAAASSYDASWAIDFSTAERERVLAEMHKALGPSRRGPFAEGLEIGAGTGYFSLNMLRSGLVERATATDISVRMLDQLRASAARLGVDVRTEQAEAEELPFDDSSFDVLYGHAVLHHIPNLERAFAEFRRVLRPGGTLAFCGEPSRNGDRLAALAKRVGFALSPLWRRLVGAPERVADGDGGARAEREIAKLEQQVDVHTFPPALLRRLLERAGFTDARIGGEGMLSSLYVWGRRALESTANWDEVPLAWKRYASGVERGLRRLDALLEPHLPDSLLYGLFLSARKPEA